MVLARRGFAVGVWILCAGATWWLPQAFVWLVREPWPWPAACMVAAGIAAVGVLATFPAGAAAWWLAVRRRWVVRLVGIVVTWMALVPVPAFWGIYLQMTDRHWIEWLQVTADGETFDVRVACFWDGWDNVYSCRAHGYERLGLTDVGSARSRSTWTRSPLPLVLLPVGYTFWTDHLEAPRPEPLLVREGRHVVFRVADASMAKPIRFR